MDLKSLMAQMRKNAQAIQALTQDVSHDRARWQPEEDAWSILDVINHLVYEEEHDFRQRLDLVLHRPEAAWPSSESARGVTETSRQRALGQSLDAFQVAREESLAWLKSLETVEWERECEAPFGGIRAGDVMAAWVAHDLLHLRQLVDLRYQYLMHHAEPYELRYAGRW